VTIAAGRREAASAVSEADEGAPADDEHTLRAAMVARDGSELGAIEVTRGTVSFTPAEELALGDLARLAALAIENVRLEERERQIARTLQASLLPARLPAIAGLEAAARYIAGGEGTLVGGDMYDLFPVGDEWAFVVGDVCGKGAEAAALTAMVRYTLRAEAAHHDSPGDVLGLTNGAILRQFDDGRFCTVLYGRARVGDGRTQLALASGGHPPPLVLRATGSVETLPCSGPLLGVVRSVRHADVAADLGPGDALVCFTDGVTEGRGPAGMFGDVLLRETLLGSAGKTADAIAERLVSAALAFQGGRTQDDLALLVLRVPPT
jgi:serine phosphatase RsbU (regulator of sigma subunit)